jgi:hypothetical protein
MDGEDEEEEEVARGSHPSSRSRINAPSSLVHDSIMQTSDEGDNSNFYRENFGSGLVNTRIADRENEVTPPSDETHRGYYSSLTICIFQLIYFFSIKPVA